MEGLPDGGTRIDAADLNHIEQGVSDACAGVDQLRTECLPTYMVLQDGDTATQDAYTKAIKGPCLILDLSKMATYYDNGEDGEAHERNLVVSGDEIKKIRDSLSLTTITSSDDFSIFRVADVAFICIAGFGAAAGPSNSPKLWTGAPAPAARCTAPLAAEDGTQGVYVEVDTNGDVSIHSPISDISYVPVYGIAVYPIA